MFLNLFRRKPIAPVTLILLYTPKTDGANHAHVTDGSSVS